MLCRTQREENKAYEPRQTDELDDSSDESDELESESNLSSHHVSDDHEIASRPHSNRQQTQ